jgi:hypothetical protein
VKKRVSIFFQKTLLCPMQHCFLLCIFLFFLLVSLLSFSLSGLIIKNAISRFRASTSHTIKSNFNTKTSKIMEQKPQNITQDPVIIQFRYSGYYQDRAEFSRLLKHNRIPYQTAIDAYRFGGKVRENRIKCGFDF